MTANCRHCRAIALLTALALCLGLTASANAALIEGTIRDSATGDPIPRVTIRVENEGRAMLGNDDGRYRLRLDPGVYQLRFSHIAYYPNVIEVTVGDSTILRDILLQSSLIELPGTRVYSRAYDPAQEIIIEAIRHKEELLGKIKDYRFEGYTKALARKLKDGQPDEYFVIIETQLEGWFRWPDQYKEIITARRQSANLPAGSALVTIGEIFNFNANRIDLGSQAVVSPTATDALNYYNYYLLDTILVDGFPAFLLEVEPKTDARPLFTGEILIVDSTFAVAGVDLGLNAGFDAPYFSNLRFSQRAARFQNDIWMPVEIRFTGDADFPIPIIPKLAFSYVGVLNNLSINEGLPDDLFDEYALEVAPEADKIDSATWDRGALVPLTDEEQDGYRHIDSLKNRPLSVKRALGYGFGGLAFATMSPAAYPFFHFNRVEGPYLGAGVNLTTLIPRSELYLKTGYAFDGEYWQHRYQISTLLHDRAQLRATIGYHDEIVARPTIFSRQYLNPTLVALMWKYNPLDYYLEKGFDVTVGVRVAPKLRLALGYHDLDQSSVFNATDFGVFDSDRHHRPNPAIADGRLRAASANLTYDSRPLMRAKGKEQRMFALPSTSLQLSFAGAEPDLIDTDFRFRRYALALRHTRSLVWGVTSLEMYLGGSDRPLPPQRYFTIEFDSPMETAMHFKTLRETNFTGDRVASFYLLHDFGATFFRRLHLPLLKALPVSLMVYGGAFWTDFRADSRIYFPAPPDEPVAADDNPLSAVAGPPISAPDWYSEIGFGVGRLPLFMQLFFTWQLSAYDTNEFSFKMSMGF